MRYGLARIDASGRVADRSILKTLGWCSGDSLVITVVDSAIVVHRDPSGVFAVPAAPYLTLPALVRRRAGVRAGDQLLVAADATCGVLVIHPLAALDTMLVTYHASLLGGDDHDGGTE
jgi:bifunctional DNA-binding transcriptional regulator/antitoxin component of YhaV-PrlF toxin-antitoxin module